jgi:hypothetical protein
VVLSVLTAVITPRCWGLPIDARGFADRAYFELDQFVEIEYRRSSRQEIQMYGRYEHRGYPSYREAV